MLLRLLLTRVYAKSHKRTGTTPVRLMLIMFILLTVNFVKRLQFGSSSDDLVVNEFNP